MAGQRIGYVRVSSLDHDAKRQLDGQVPDREGDTVVVHSMDRLCRNLDDLRALDQGLARKGVRVEFLNESLVFTGEDSPMANPMLSVMGAFAEFERSLIRERQREASPWPSSAAPIRGGKRP